MATMPPYFRTLPLVTSSDERRFALGRRALATGVLDTGSGFPAVALTSLSTVEAELRRAGLELDSAFASQGFVSHHLEACGTLAREDPTRFGELMDLVFEHASNPATLDAAAQVVAVASKNEREGNNHREEAD